MSSQKKITAVCKKVEKNKDPGMDGRPNIALHIAMQKEPEMFLHIYISYLRKGTFPAS